MRGIKKWDTTTPKKQTQEEGSNRITFITNFNIQFQSIKRIVRKYSLILLRDPKLQKVLPDRP